MSKASRDVWGQEEQKTLRWFDEERGELPFKTPARAPSTMGLAGRGCTKSKQQHLIFVSILRPCAWPQPDVPRALERANGAEKTSTRAQNLITCNDCFFTTCHCASNVLGDALGSIRRGKWLLALTSFHHGLCIHRTGNIIHHGVYTSHWDHRLLSRPCNK